MWDFIIGGFFGLLVGVVVGYEVAQREVREAFKDGYAAGSGLDGYTAEEGIYDEWPVSEDHA